MNDAQATHTPCAGTSPLRLDTRGLQCPLPVLKARKALKGMSSGDILELITDDPVADIDVPHFCTEAGHGLIDCKREGKLRVFQIARA